MTPQTLIHDVLPQEVTHALGYTLLHSLWQGALMALLVGVLLRLMHRHSAATRYWVTWGALMALLVVSVVTYWKLYAPAAAPQEVAAQTSGGVQWETTVLQAAPASFWETAVTQGQAYFNQHLPAVVLLWLMGLLLMGLRVLGGWAYVQRLRSYRTRDVPEVWQQKAQELSRQLGLNQLVKVTESALVQVPMVIGHFKPLILLPLGALTGLATAQVEAILAHELAHIHRRDYLLNLLQSMVETLFFFHPAVWWISDCARTEREHACDDLALELCGDSLTYAYALTNLEELIMKTNVTSPRLAMAFSGRRRSLLSRITRLVQKSALRPSFSEGFLASCAVMAGVLAFSASAWANYTVPEKPLQAENPAEKPVPANAMISAAAEEKQEALDEDLTLQQLEDGLVIVQNKKGKVVEVYVNGRRIPKSELGKYQSRIDQQLASARKGKTLRDDEEVEAAMEEVEASLGNLEERGLGRLAPLPPMPPMPRTPSAFRGSEIAPVPPVPPVPPLPEDKEGNKRYEASMKEYEARQQEYEARMEAFAERQVEFGARMEVSQERRKEQQARREEEHKRRMAEHAVRQKEHEKRMAEHAVRMKEHDERMKKHDAMMKELKAALVSDGLIKSADADYEFKLDKSGLYVNDKKQSDALFQKYKKLMQATTGEDVELLLKKEGSNFRIQSNRHTEKSK
ncbi:M56 family metallopeptidase [Rufibacter sediminis]|uniref:M48 family metalloprotease n=1 Tax=Rufibacter sediminis TaxID=2762756 RepID=A0ABR6VU62_9BACT|nr:M56 family metallopeptidase [Rufibacter sediminis]MBC3540740.1 M48 family metalloprotease [Rufibacter sediminis]